MRRTDPNSSDKIDKLSEKLIIKIIKGFSTRIQTCVQIHGEHIQLLMNNMHYPLLG